jgi:hypothetical protein
MLARYLLLLALITGTPVQSAPLPNLALACSDESAIGQEFDACSSYVYEIPTNQLIVVSSSYIWCGFRSCRASVPVQAGPPFRFMPGRCDAVA